jgi:hypothetical protein
VEFFGSLEQGGRYGYVKKSDYAKWAPEDRERFPPLFATKNFYLITNAVNRNAQLAKVLPFPIY